MMLDVFFIGVLFGVVVVMLANIAIDARTGPGSVTRRGGYGGPAPVDREPAATPAPPPPRLSPPQPKPAPANVLLWDHAGPVPAPPRRPPLDDWD